MKSWPGGGAQSPNSTYKNMPYRLDKLRSALAEAQLKTRMYSSRLRTTRFSGCLLRGGCLPKGVCMVDTPPLGQTFPPPGQTSRLGRHPPPGGQKEWHKPVKTLPSRNYCRKKLKMQQIVTAPPLNMYTVNIYLSDNWQVCRLQCKGEDREQEHKLIKIGVIALPKTIGLIQGIGLCEQILDSI